MAALTKHAAEASLLDLGFIVVSALCQQCAANKTAFQRAGVVHYTLRILSRGTCSQHTVGLGLGALTAVADENRDLLYDLTSANSLKIVNQACVSFPEANWSDEFAQQYCVFVGRLACIGPAVQRKLTQLNFIELLIRCVTKHLVSLPVCRAGMWAVSELSFRCADHSSKLGELCRALLPTPRYVSMLLLRGAGCLRGGSVSAEAAPQCTARGAVGVCCSGESNCE